MASEYRALAGWLADDHAAALPALRASCDWFARNAPHRRIDYGDLVGTVADWHAICAEVSALSAAKADDVRVFFERHFVPVSVGPSAQSEGLFTGYYAPSLRGSWVKTSRFSTPIYRKPARAAGRRLPPRAGIVDGALDGQGLELLWVDDAVDAYFLEIQGSGTVVMADGSVVAVGYAGQNGHSYYPIGRTLVDSEVTTMDALSMEMIRDWLRDHPDQAQPLMNLNPSYVFFKLNEGGVVEGTIEEPLTPGRSIAVDPDHVPLGVALWLDVADVPAPGCRLRRLVMAHDTGGSIEGVMRGDLFWGYGEAPGRHAGGMRARGWYTMLVPRAVLDTIDVPPAQRSKGPPPLADAVAGPPAPACAIADPADGADDDGFEIDLS